MNKKIFGSSEKLAEAFAEVFEKICDEYILKIGIVNIALSGGTTPKLFFEILSKKYIDKLDWSKINFYWADERCVPPESDESNHGEADRILFSKIHSKKNVYPVNGNNDPVNEAVRYSELLEKNLPFKNNFPRFDIILLGMGEDGHIASIFPDQMNLLTSEKICEVAVHPVSQQKRITLTGIVIKNPDRIFFLVTGRSKAEVVKEILKKKNIFEKYPASHITPTHGKSEWYLDSEAADLL
ncbi:MAG: 6-phosphogluconolactonase [Ignavibacteria bacterium]